MFDIDNIFNSDAIKEEVTIDRRPYMFKLVLSIGTLYGSPIKEVSPYKHIKEIFKLFSPRFEVTLKENCLEHMQNYKNHETIIIEFDMKRPFSVAIILSLLQNIALLFNCSKHVKDLLNRVTYVMDLVPEKNRSQLYVANLYRHKSDKESRIDNLMRALAYVKVEKDVFKNYDTTLSSFVYDTNRLMKFMFNENWDFRIPIEKWIVYQTRR